MKQSLLKRKAQPNAAKPEPAAPPVSTSSHPGYAPDAALHAIKRHALEFVNPKELQVSITYPIFNLIQLTLLYYTSFLVYIH